MSAPDTPRDALAPPAPPPLIVRHLDHLRIQRRLAGRVLQQGIGQGRQVHLAVRAAQHIGHAYGRFCVGYPRLRHTQGTAGHGDFTQVETLTRATRTALHHHQAGFGGA